MSPGPIYSTLTNSLLRPLCSGIVTTILLCAALSCDALGYTAVWRDCLLCIEVRVVWCGRLCCPAVYCAVLCYGRCTVAHCTVVHCSKLWCDVVC
jgi:hypothetical protein